MDATAFFPSRWLSAEDLGDKAVKAIITGLKKEEVGQDNKPVVYFLGFTKGLVLNKTNTNKLIELFGKDTDGWANKDVELYPVVVPYRGDEVPAIRLRAPQLPAAPQGAPAPSMIDNAFVEVEKEAQE